MLRKLELTQLIWGLGFAVAVAISLIVTWTCWRFGNTYGGITGDLTVDGYAMAALDVLKMFLPAVAAAFWHRKSRVASIVCWALAAVLVTGSLYAGVTMAGYGRATAMAQQTLDSTKVTDLRGQMQDLQRQLEVLGDAKPVAAAEADLRRHASSSLWAQANNCNLPVPGGFQRYCAEYQRLMSALAASQSAAEIRGELETVRTQLATATTIEAVRPSNPAWEAIERVTGWQTIEITAAWAITLILALEAFSAAIPSAVLRAFPRGPASLPERAADAARTVLVEALPEGLPTLSGDNPPPPQKPRGGPQRQAGRKPSPKPSLGPENRRGGRPRLSVVEPSLDAGRASPDHGSPPPGGSVAAFLATLPVVPGREYRFAALQEAYVAWAKREGIARSTTTGLALALKAADFEARKTRGVMVYRDCRLPVAISA
jgi:hypothetical protein